MSDAERIKQLEQELAEARKRIEDEAVDPAMLQEIGKLKAERDSALKALAESEKERERLRKQLMLAVDILERGEFTMPPKAGHVHGPEGNCDGDCVDWVRFCDMIQDMKKALTPESGEGKP